MKQNPNHYQTLPWILKVGFGWLLLVSSFIQQCDLEVAVPMIPSSVGDGHGPRGQLTYLPYVVRDKGGEEDIFPSLT